MARARKSTPQQMDIEDALLPPEHRAAHDVHYSRLHPSKRINARAGDYSPEGIAELAALIRTQGLLVPLLVRQAKPGEYDICDGERRHAAIGKLIADRVWPESRLVPCVVVDGEDRAAREMSLVANIAREPMHPVRELEVFAEIHSQGADVATIAHRYGVSEKLVKQRLALGGLAPEIREAWRTGQINAETAQAFAVCHDVKRQAKVFAELAKKNRDGRVWSHDVRHALFVNRPRLNDPRIELIGGLDAYKAAGGVAVESLFEGDGYLEDGELLERMVSEQTAARCAELVKDGWAWAVPIDDVNKQGWWSWQRLKPGKVTYTAEETARLAALGEEEQKLEELDSPDDEQSDRVDAIQYENAAIEAAAEARAFSDTQKRKSGCVVDGATVHRGVVRPKTEKAGAKGKGAADIADDDNDIDNPGIDPKGEQQDDGAGISNALMLTITERQTVAAAKVVAQSPLVAQRLLIAALQSMMPRPVKIDVQGFHEVRSGVETGHHFRERLAETAKSNLADLVDDAARLLASTLDLRIYDARNTLTGSYHGADPENHRALIDALPGDLYLAAMREEFNAQDFFSRAPAAVIKAAIAEMEPQRQVSANAKKKDLVEIAAELADRMGWLPAELRHPKYELLGEGFAQALKGKGSRKKAA